MKIIFRLVTVLVVLTLIAAAGLLLLPVKGDIPVLVYHSTGTVEETVRSKNIVTKGIFRKQMELLKLFRYRVISLDEYYAIRTGKKQPLGREIVLTFDDGDQSYARDFYPILKEFGFPSAEFVVSESIKQGTNGSMSEAVIRDLMKDPLVSIGVHSKTHPHLHELDAERLRSEVAGAKQELEAMFGREMKDFCYPFGELNETVIQAVKDAGYRMAFTTSLKRLKKIPEGLWTVTRLKMAEEDANPVLFLVNTSGVYQNFKRLRRSMN